MFMSVIFLITKSETARLALLMENIFTAGKHCLTANETTKLQTVFLSLEITCLLFMKKKSVFFLVSFSSEHIFVRML